MHSFGVPLIEARPQVSSLLHKAKNRVHELLKRRLSELHAVAEALIRDETLDSSQITAICNGVTRGNAAEATRTVLAEHA
jgi:ATP-dependent Zn protease